MATDYERYERDMLKTMAKLSDDWKTVDRLGHTLDQVNDPDLEEILVSAMIRELDILAPSMQKLLKIREELHVASMIEEMDG